MTIEQAVYADSHQSVCEEIGLNSIMDIIGELNSDDSILDFSNLAISVQTVILNLEE